jgi:hypothetical protein
MDRRNQDCRVRSRGRTEARARASVGSASYAGERLIAELRELGRELIDEPVPPDLVDIVRPARDRDQDEGRAPRRPRRASSL